MFKENKEVLDTLFEAVSGGPQDEAVPKNSLDKDVSDFLLADLEAKVVEILQEAKKIARHSKRHVLTTQDISLSMQKLSIPDTYGYPSSTPFSYSKIAHEQQNIWYYKPQNINLREFVQKPGFEQQTLPLSYSKYFTAVDGEQPETAENVREV